MTSASASNQCELMAKQIYDRTCSDYSHCSLALSKGNLSPKCLPKKSSRRLPN